MLLLTLLSFAVAWWLGIYLIARDPRKPLLRRAGLGLLAYALALAADLLRAVSPEAQQEPLARLHTLLVFLPALLWTGATLLLLPDESAPDAGSASPHRSTREPLDRVWRLALVPVTLVTLLLAAGGALPGAAPGEPAYPLLAALVLLPLAVCLALLLRSRRVVRPASALGLALVATLFFGLGFGLLLFPLGLVPRAWGLLGIGVDLALLGLAVAAWDAFAEGESLRRDMLRSAIGAAAAALLFGSQVGLAIAVGAGATPPMVALLLATVAGGIATQTLAGPLQALLDRLAFAREPGLLRARAELRASEAALPRLRLDPEIAALDEAEFARLTRRALSHYGDLARLAASPLTRLPQIEERLGERGAPDQPIERAAELQALLAESIARLKPREGGEFGTSDAWRYYNALYFPYVAGVKPYRRRGDTEDLDRTARQALAWFDSQVPQRTLHNWQNAAARLVARDLRHRLEEAEG
jgi:hypothetical protein